MRVQDLRRSVGRACGSALPLPDLLSPCTMLARDLFGRVRTISDVDGGVHVDGAALVRLGEVPSGVLEGWDRRWCYSILLCSGVWSSCWSGRRWPDLLPPSVYTRRNHFCFKSGNTGRRPRLLFTCACKHLVLRRSSPWLPRCMQLTVTHR